MAKQCKDCGEVKPLDEYHKHPSCKGGFRPKCKACTNRENRAYYEENKESVKLWTREYKKLNSERVKVKNQDYYRRNKHEYLARDAQRRVAKMRATPPWLSEAQKEQIKDFYWLARDLKLVSGESYHVDHIVPLQGKNICGLHVPWNLQILPAKVNIAKSNNWS